MIPDLHIVALGARTPLGLTAESSAAAVRAGLSRFGECPIFVDPKGEPLKCARDAHLLPDLPVVERMVALAQHALAEVARKLMVHTGRSLDVPVILALPRTRPGFRTADAEHIAHQVAATPLPGILVAGVRWVQDDHAGAMRAVWELTRAKGGPGLGVVCGVDSYLDPYTLDWLDTTRRIVREGVRDGFVPGEAAGAIALATGDARAYHRLPSLARVRGASVAVEERSPASPVGLLGEGLTRAIVDAGAGLRLPDERVDEVLCDLNGERHRSDDWGFAMLRAPGYFRDATAYRAATGLWGDVGAASGALGCALAVEAWRRGYARGPRAMVWGSSLAGLRGAVVLERARD